MTEEKGLIKRSTTEHDNNNLHDNGSETVRPNFFSFQIRSVQSFILI